MSILGEIIRRLGAGGTVLETYGRRGELVRKIDSGEFVRAVARYRHAFRGWSTPSYHEHRVVGLLFRPEETVEFLVATFAAVAEGFTVVPFYPTWSEETQLLHLRQYRIRSMAVGEGLRERVEGWTEDLDRVVPVSSSLDDAPGGPVDEPYPTDIGEHHPLAWIFTSGTSGEVPKCTVISLRNIAAAVDNIRHVDFIREGMAIHSPLSTSHIFAFAVVLGILAIRPSRVLFSDVQYLARLPQERIGKVDGVILVPLVLNRMRSAFYERLVENGASADPRLRKIPLRVRRFLKTCVQRAEESVIAIESGRPSGVLTWPAVAVARAVFGRSILARLGSPGFVVVGGAKPNVHSMAFLDVMGIRCLQGWGMTETTGALAVCKLGDRFRGAYGTCGDVFDDTRAYVEDGELVVEGPQVAEGYIHPDGRFDPFNGVKRTGDYAEFDARGRLRVLGKTSDRITLTNGLNYNPISLEEEIADADVSKRNLLDAVVIVGDGQPRLGCVFFLRAVEGQPPGDEIPADVERYLAELLRESNASRPVDEQIGPWTASPIPVRDAGFVGPSGKIRRRLVETHYQFLFERSKKPRLDRVLH